MSDAPAPRLHPDHVAAMLRAEDLDRKLVAKQRTIEALESDLTKATRALEHARREAAELPKVRPMTRVLWIGAGAIFGVLVAAVAAALLRSPALDAAASPDPQTLDVPLHGSVPRPPPAIPRDDRGWHGRVSTSSSSVLPPGTVCEVSITVTPGNDPGCQARVDCGARTIYGPAPAGMFDCRIDGFDANGRARISGQDDQVTASDGDPAMRLDTGMRSVRIWDNSPGREGFDVTITLDAA